LPIPAEIGARLVPHRQRHDAVGLGAVRVFAVILAPSRLSCEPHQVRAGYVVVMPDLAAPHPAKVALGRIRVDLVFAAETAGPRDIASMLLPLTSLQKIAMACKSARSGILRE
jgi:hypothetical protein